MNCPLEENSELILLYCNCRYNHATLTVPGDMFPQCVGEPSEEQKAEAQREAEEEERKESAPLFRK